MTQNNEPTWKGAHGKRIVIKLPAPPAVIPADERAGLAVLLAAAEERIEEFRTLLTETLRFLSKIAELVDGTPEADDLNQLSDVLSDEIYQVLEKTL